MSGGSGQLIPGWVEGAGGTHKLYHVNKCHLPPTEVKMTALLMIPALSRLTERN